MRGAPALVAALLFLAEASSLPASLLEDAQRAEMRSASKVSEAASTLPPPPSAVPNRLSDATSSVYRIPGPGGKTVAQYEKGYLYGSGKAAMDKHVENALLKSELFGDPSAVNQYRYYGGSTDSRADPRAYAPPTKRSGYPRALPLSQPQPATRPKRDLQVDPEEVLALLALWQNNNVQPYRAQGRWPGYGNEPDELDLPDEQEGEDMDGDDQNSGEWLEGPVYPSGRTHYSVDRRALYYPAAVPYPPALAQYQFPMQKRETAWGGFAKDKRFMVSRKRQAPSVQSQGGIHSLAQLLGQRVPLYHRVVL